MKKLFLLILVLFVLGCGSTAQKTLGDIKIQTNPAGGINRTFVDCWFTSKSTGNPINLTVEWWWQNGFGFGDRVIKSETKIAAASNLQIVKYEAPAGYILLNYFWVEIKWTDDEGFHALKSSKAYCFSLSGNKSVSEEANI